MRRRLEEELHGDPEFARLLEQVVARRLDPASAALALLERESAAGAVRGAGALRRPG